MATPYWPSAQLPGQAAYPPQPYPAQPYPQYYQPHPPYYAGPVYQPAPPPPQAPFGQATQLPYMIPRNAQYPDLHPCLSTDSNQIRWSVRRRPYESLPLDVHRIASDSALREPVKHLRLISKDFPWMVDVVPRPGYNYVAVGDVWTTLYDALQEPMTASEWSIAGSMDFQKAIEEAMQKRIAGGDPQKVAKRIDWLGRTRMFKGLAKDEALAKRPLLPGTEPCAATWAVVLAAT